MGIRFLCQTCDRKIHVKAFLAGKRGICPYCGERVYIPIENQLPSKKKENAAAEQNGDNIAIPATATNTEQVPPSNGAPTAVAVPTAQAVAAEVESAADPIDEAPNAIWYVRPPSGGQFGPADGEVMRRWVTEGRVSSDSLIWREGWDDWQLAEPLFPSLSGAPTPPHGTSSTTESSAPATANAAISSPLTQSSTPTAARLRGRRGKSKSMGVAVIVVLGVLIVGLAVVLFAIIAN